MRFRFFSRAVDVLRTCEELRRGNAFDETVKAKLREPGKEFSLFRDDGGKWRFRPDSLRLAYSLTFGALEPIMDSNESLQRAAREIPP